MLFYFAVIIPSFAVLAWSADRFVYGAGGFARKLGMSPLLVGLVIVGFGTSAPELLVSALTATAGNSGLAVGNALGSNIANIALILALTAAFIPLVSRPEVTQRELVALIAVTLLTPLLLLDGQLGALDGWLLLCTLVVTVAWLTRTSLAGSRAEKTALSSAETEAEADPDIPPPLPIPVALGWILGGLALLLISARTLVWASVELATAAGVSDLVIGLSIVAVGTSLPELATAIAAARQRQHDMVLGNILGSNLFNLLGVLGVVGAINPTALSGSVLLRDYLLMAALTLFLAWLVVRRHGMSRWVAVMLLLVYAGYQTLILTT